MTPTLIKCPECGLANRLADPNCKRCKFAFQPETSAAGAIRMPSQSLPESSFADLYEPDDGGFIPSHSQTPQMAARMAAVRQSAGQNQKYDQFLTPQAEIRQLPPENPAPHVFREDSSPRVVDALIPVKPKNGIAVASMILGIIGLLTAIFLVGFCLR